jgi:hypothetical protein
LLIVSTIMTDKITNNKMMTLILDSKRTSMILKVGIKIKCQLTNTARSKMGTSQMTKVTSISMICQLTKMINNNINKIWKVMVKAR